MNPNDLLLPLQERGHKAENQKNMYTNFFDRQEATMAIEARKLALYKHQMKQKLSKNLECLKQGDIFRRRRNQINILCPPVLNIKPLTRNVLCTLWQACGECPAGQTRTGCAGEVSEMCFRVFLKVVFKGFTEKANTSIFAP